MVLPNPEVSDQKKESSNTKTPTSPKNVAGGGPQRAKAQPENQVDSLFLPGVSSKVYLGKANPWRELGTLILRFIDITVMVAVPRIKARPFCVGLLTMYFAQLNNFVVLRKVSLLDF